MKRRPQRQARAEPLTRPAPAPLGPGGTDPAPDLGARFGVGNVERVFGLCAQVLDRRWSVSDVGVPSRWISHWDRAHVLMDVEREGTGWRKFSFIDYVWLRIVCELRGFGLALPAIRRVKEILAAPLPVEPRLVLRKTQQRSSYNVLLLLIAEAVVTKAPINLLVRADGETLLYNENQADAYGTELELFRTAPHVCVPLTGMLGEMIRRNSIDFIVPRIPLLSRPEAETLALLREGRLNRLEATLVSGETLTVIPPGSPDPAAAERTLLERLMLHPYQEIRYETDDGKQVAFHPPAAGSGFGPREHEHA
jgi:DNA-binding transcriptional MerR regulator